MPSLELDRSTRRRRLAWCALLLVPACSNTYYRKAADEEVARLIAEKSNDPRWNLPGFTIDVDPRSRYYDPTDPDHPPMPPDDPASHQFMEEVDGMAGWSGWDDQGIVNRLENPEWRKHLEEGLERTTDDRIKLRLEDAVRLALRHSPNYQEQLESIYLSALDVSTERFRFDVQFFGGFVGAAQHQGSENPGGESNTVSVAPFARVSKGFATAGELLVTFANSVVWEFFGPNDGFTTSRIGLTFVQPLLRGGGRAVALEQLTIAERTLLANLRAFQFYRQGFYTQVAIGELGVSGPQRRGGFFGGTGLTGFTGQGSGGFGGVGDATGFGRGGFGGGGAGGAGGAGFAGGGAGTVGGFIGLLQQTQQIRNTRDSLNLQLRTLALLEANLEAGLIDIAQVDQFRQNIETERANLLQAQNSLLASLDSFNRSVLGLPPDLPMEPDDSLIRPFQLIDPAITALQDELAGFIDRFGELPEQPDVESIRRALEEIEPLRRKIGERLDGVPGELQRLDAKSEERTRSMTPVERRLFEDDVRRLAEELRELRGRFDETPGALERLRTGLGPDTAVQTADGIVQLLTDLSNIVGEISLVEARARLETITVAPVELDPGTALDIARAARLDWMNNRAALVDSWRLIEFNANALQSDLTLLVNGDISTLGGNNPVKFRDETATLRAGLEFDGPFTRLVERNSFRQQLIEYQQDRRQLIQFEDGLSQTMRQALRSLEELRVNLEIQRRAVAIAIRRVDQTREALNRPVPPTAPGQAPQALGPTAAQNLLFALSDLRNTQNNLMSVWLNHLSARMSLYREMGIMRVDDQGLWIDEPLPRAIREVAKMADKLPPEIPAGWLAAAGTPAADPTAAPSERSDGTQTAVNGEGEARHGTGTPN
jgi:outer membrane protein TolC